MILYDKEIRAEWRTLSEHIDAAIARKRRREAVFKAERERDREHARRLYELHPDRIYNDDGTFRPSADDYMRAAAFINMLKASVRAQMITDQQARDLRYRALHGDLTGAERSYRQIIGTSLREGKS